MGKPGRALPSVDGALHNPASIKYILPKGPKPAIPVIAQRSRNASRCQSGNLHSRSIRNTPFGTRPFASDVLVYTGLSLEKAVDTETRHAGRQ